MKGIFPFFKIVALVLFFCSNSLAQPQLDTTTHLSASSLVRISSQVNDSIWKTRLVRNVIEKKIESSILEILAQVNASLAPPSPLNLNSWAKIDQKGNIYVYVYTAEGYKITDVRNKLKFLGILPVSYSPNVSIISVWLSPADIRNVATLNEVGAIRLVTNAFSNTGPVCTKGDSIMRDNIVRRIWPSADGSGITVGIISDDCGKRESMLTSRIANHELPASVDVELDNYTPQSIDPQRSHEGLAMLEIVHDLAPGASLVFAEGMSNITNFADNIRTLANRKGCNVICDDILHFDEPYFEDGEVAKAIEEVTASKDVVYITAAGNYGQDVHSFVFKPLNVQLLDPNMSLQNYTVHNFDDAGKFDNPIDLQPGYQLEIWLQWEEHFGGAANDFNLFLYDESNRIIKTKTASSQSGRGNPIEHFWYQNTSSQTESLGIIVQRENAPTKPTPRMKLLVYSTDRLIHPDYNNGVSSVLGHCMASSAVSCSAISAEDNSQAIEQMSSRGPISQVFFSKYNIASGSLVMRTGVEDRVKPDVASFDRVMTSVPGFKPFPGTSAAAPHVAALAAQIRGANTSLSSQEVRDIIHGGTIRYTQSSGIDPSSYGFGRSDAFKTLAPLMPQKKFAKFSSGPYFSMNSGNTSSIIGAMSIPNTITVNDIYISVTVDGHNGYGNLSFDLVRASGPGGKPNASMSLMKRIFNGQGWGANPNVVFGDDAPEKIQDRTLYPLTLGYFIPNDKFGTSSVLNGKFSAQDQWLLEVTFPTPVSPAHAPVLKDWGIFIR